MHKNYYFIQRAKEKNMAYSVQGTTIRLTRGDSLILQVVILRNNEIYTPQEGDKVRFALKRNMMNPEKTRYLDKNPLVVKDIPIKTLILRLDSEDTKFLEFGNYIYDIEITFANGLVDTFIADAAFIITPEVH